MNDNPEEGNFPPDLDISPADSGNNEQNTKADAEDPDGLENYQLEGLSPDDFIENDNSDFAANDNYTEQPSHRNEAGNSEGDGQTDATEDVFSGLDSLITGDPITENTEKVGNGDYFERIKVGDNRPSSVEMVTEYPHWSTRLLNEIKMNDKTALSISFLKRFRDRELAVQDKTVILGSKKKLPKILKNLFLLQKLKDEAKKIYLKLEQTKREEIEIIEQTFFPIQVELDLSGEQDDWQHRDKLKSVDHFQGKQGRLLFGGIDIARVKLLAGRRENVDIEVLETSGSQQLAHIRNKIGEFPFPVSIEIGRTQISWQEAGSLGIGSIINLNRGVGDYIDLILEDYDRKIASGEAVSVDCQKGFRVTEKIVNLPQASMPKPLEFNRKNSDLGVQVRCVWGQCLLTYDEVNQITEGSILELEEGIGYPVKVEIGSEVRAKGEVVVIDETFALRITDFPDDRPSKLETIFTEGKDSKDQKASKKNDDLDKNRIGENQTNETKIERTKALPSGDFPELGSDEKSLFAFLREIDPAFLLDFIQGEHPQLIALVLSTLGVRHASLIISGLPHQIQADVVKRIAIIDRVHPEIIRLLMKQIKTRLSDLGHEGFFMLGGIDNVADILNLVDRGTEKIVIEALEEEDPELAEEIKKKMFVFEDIIILEDNHLQRVLQKTDIKTLAKALKAADAELQEKFLRNMSKDVAEQILDQMKSMGSIRLKEAEEKQQIIVGLIRALEQNGDISFDR